MSSTLVVERWGRGPTVLLLHGLGASARYWHPLRDIEPAFRGVAPDLLGFGSSPSPPHASYDVDSHLEGLVPLFGEAAVVVGHSAGAILAAALAARRPDQVRGLVLVGLPAYPDAATARREIGTLGLLARLTVDGHPAARWLCTTICRFQSVAVALAPHVQRDLPAEIASDAARHTWPSYSQTLERVVVDHRVAPDLLATTCPVRLVHGTDDPTAPSRHVRRLVDELRAAGRDVVLYQRSGDHHLAVRRPETVAEVVRRLATVGPP